MAHRRQSMRKKLNKCLYRISAFYEKIIGTAQDYTTQAKHFKITGTIWVFVNRHAYKEKLEENVNKSNQIPDVKLSRLAGMKFNFLM